RVDAVPCPTARKLSASRTTAIVLLIYLTLASDASGALDAPGNAPLRCPSGLAIMRAFALRFAMPSDLLSRARQQAECSGHSMRLAALLRIAYAESTSDPLRARLPLTHPPHESRYL